MNCVWSSRRPRLHARLCWTGSEFWGKDCGLIASTQSLAWHENPQQYVQQQADPCADEQHGQQKPPYPGFHSGRTRDSAAHAAEPPVCAVASKGIYGRHEWVNLALLLGIQHPLLRTFELLLRQNTVSVQFRQFAKFISKHHGALLERDLSP